MIFLNRGALAVGVACWWLCQTLAGQGVTEEGAIVKKLATGMSFTEGPVWLPKDGVLVFSDIPNSKLMQWSEAQGLSVYRECEQANGNILDLEGRLISCQHAARNVVRWSADGNSEVLVERYQGQRFNSPNDVAVRSDGTLWFTDPPWGLREEPELPGHWVFKFDPVTGGIEVLIRDLAMPNGINFSPDESRLYVADTGGNRRHPDPAYHETRPGVHCYQINADGTLGDKRFTIPHGSDGMAVDVEGNLYTTDGGKVLIYDGDGNKIDEIRVPENPANVTFGGEDGRTLFITARTSLYSIRMKHAGAKPLQARW
jgi:gluconolactonase